MGIGTETVVIKIELFIVCFSQSTQGYIKMKWSQGLSTLLKVAKYVQNTISYWTALNRWRVLNGCHSTPWTVEYRLAVWEMQYGQVASFSRGWVQWKIKKRLHSTGAHVDSYRQFAGSRDQIAAIELYCYWKRNAVNELCNLSASISVSGCLTHSPFLTVIL